MTSCSTREVGPRFFVSVGMACIRLPVSFLRFLLRMDMFSFRAVDNIERLIPFPFQQSNTRREPCDRRSQQDQYAHCVGSHQGGGREGCHGGDIHRRRLAAGRGAQIGRRRAGPLSKVGCARQQRRRDVRNTAADEGRHRTTTWRRFCSASSYSARLKESAAARIITTASQLVSATPHLKRE